jgi:hypothetical protein
MFFLHVFPSNESKFKSELKKIDETENHAVPKHYFYGPRKLNTILTQLRSSASFLNYDLFRVGIVSDPSCRCGAVFEDLKHFFLDCPIYLQARTKMIDNINMVTTYYTLDIKIQTFQISQKSCDLKARIPQRQDDGTK